MRHASRLRCFNKLLQLQKYYYYYPGQSPRAINVTAAPRTAASLPSSTWTHHDFSTSRPTENSPPNYYDKSSSTPLAMAPPVRLASNVEDPVKSMEQLEALLGNGWTLDENQCGIRKTYFFKTYTKALDFVQMIGIASKSSNHHSVMEVVRLTYILLVCLFPCPWAFANLRVLLPAREVDTFPSIGLLIFRVVSPARTSQWPNIVMNRGSSSRRWIGQKLKGVPQHHPNHHNH